VDPTFSKKHSAVFPKELCKKVIEYYSFIGDLVFDPFAGSGTLGQVAIECNRKFFLTEVDKNYFSSIKSLFTTPNLFQSDFDVAFFNQKSFRDRIDKNK
jgi:DNA modification methylase